MAKTNPDAESIDDTHSQNDEIVSAPVSVIIPTLDDAARIGPCLGALGDEVMSGVIREVIIADGGSADEIAEIADAIGARLVTTSPGRGSQLAAGADAATGEWLLFLHADTVLPEGWPEHLRHHLQTASDKAGYFSLRFDQDSLVAKLTSAWANLRSRLFALPYGDQGLFVSRMLYRKAGGFPDWPLMEDVALVRRIGRRRLQAIPASAVTSAERYCREGWARRGWRNLSTLTLYFLGVAPDRLVARYRGRE